jgi:hypothetical protein
MNFTMFSIPNRFHIYSLVILSVTVTRNIFLSTLFSNTHSIFSSLSVIDQVSHPYKAAGKIALFFTFSERIREEYL